MTFKALQTYSNGEVVRWIGPESSPNPAPGVTVDAAAGAPGSAGANQAAPVTPARAATDSSGSDTLSIVALVVGALGLAAGAAALALGRRRGTLA